jgi:hypothetical protein
VLGISQSRLARLSEVSRFKICVFELGSGSLTADEQSRVREALRAEAERLRLAAALIVEESSAKLTEVR